MKKNTLVKSEESVLDKPSKKKAFIKELERIEKEEGIITPIDVIDRARSTASPIHDLFEWDNKEAGERYRLIQARLYISTVKVEIMGKRIGGYFNTTIKVNKLPVRGYFSTKRVLSDKKLTDAVLGQAVRELEYWNQKYNTLKELTGVVDLDKLSKLKTK